MSDYSSQHHDSARSGRAHRPAQSRPSSRPSTRAAGDGEREPRAPRSRAQNAAPRAEAAPQEYVVPDNLLPIGGRQAVLALFAKRPHCIHKLWLNHDSRKDYGEICQYLAANKKSYALTDDREMDREFGGSEHEGVIAFAHSRQSGVVSLSRVEEWRKAGEPLLLLPELDSPRTLGRMAALARAFGLSRILIDREDNFMAEHPLAYAAAGGALEQVQVFCWEGRLTALVKPLKDRFLVVGLGGTGASRPNWGKPLSAPGRPLALIASDPLTGLGNELIPHCEHRLQLPGMHPEALSRAEAVSPMLNWLLSKAKNPTAPEHGFRARQKQKKEQGGGR